MALFAASRILNIFDLKGSTAALFVGAFVVFTGTLSWLILMLVFSVGSHIATKAWINRKRDLRLQEGTAGERSSSNVIYAAVIGLGISSLNFAHVVNAPYFELFAISFAVVNADTFASEIGVLDKKVYLITNLKRVQPGVNGGVSVLGQIAALGGSFVIAITYGLLSYPNVNILSLVLIGVMGFVGCQIDSLLGATLENRDRLTKGEVNFISSFMAVALSVALFSF